MPLTQGIIRSYILFLHYELNEDSIFFLFCCLFYYQRCEDKKPNPIIKVEIKRLLNRNEKYS